MSGGPAIDYSMIVGTIGSSPFTSHYLSLFTHSAMPHNLLHRFVAVPFFIVTCFAFASLAYSDEDPKSASDAEPKPIVINGVVEAVNSEEIAPKSEQFTAWEISRLLPHGAKVRKGQNIVWFATEEIDKKIKEAEIDLQLAKLGLEDEEFGYQQFLELQKLDREAAELARKEAQQNYDNFVRVDRDRSILSAEFNLKSAQQSLDNVTEELVQLTQMYEEDGLTEESEEIVLKRAKQAVEGAQFRLDGVEIATERTIKQALPRSVATQEATLARAMLTFKKAVRDLDAAKRKRDIEIKRKRDQFEEQKTKLEELKTERKQSVLASSIDGIVLHGKLNRGKLGDKPSTLEVGSKVTPDQVVVTVANPTKFQIRVDLDEKHRQVAAKGAKCNVKLVALPSLKATGVVRSVSNVPYASGKYDCIVTFQVGSEQAEIVPTMACELEFEPEK